MTLQEIADTITPTGYAAAIVGLVLCLVVVLLRFRARNLAEEQAYQAAVSEEEEEAGAPAEEAEAPPVEPVKPKTPFKTYVPGEDESTSE